MTSLAALKKKASKLLTEYENTEPEARTPVTRALAETFVEARSHFTDADGEIDWRGKTYPYRQWIREIFADHNIGREDSKRLQSAVRYHVGSVLRSRLPEKERERLGLIEETPKERSQERRQTRTAMLNALTSRDVAGGGLMALTALNAIIQRVDAEEIAGLDESGRAVAVATLKDLERRTAALLRAVQ